MIGTRGGRGRGGGHGQGTSMPQGDVRMGLPRPLLAAPVTPEYAQMAGLPSTGGAPLIAWGEGGGGEGTGRQGERSVRGDPKSTKTT